MPPERSPRSLPCAVSTVGKRSFSVMARAAPLHHRPPDAAAVKSNRRRVSDEAWSCGFIGVGFVFEGGRGGGSGRAGPFGLRLPPFRLSPPPFGLRYRSPAPCTAHP